MTTFISHRHLILSGFWGEKQQTIRTVTIPYQWDVLNDRVKGADKSGAVRNLRIAAGRSTGTHYGFVFQDSDLAKWIEAAAYAIETRADPVLERMVDRLVLLIEAAQDGDGYLNSAFTIENRGKRWTDLRDNHEMYVSGHMLEAAIAYFEATGKRRFLDVMLRNVDLIDRLFGRRKDQKRGYPGHPELEQALVRLYRVTGNRRHLRLAAYFVDERGRAPRYFDQETKRLKKEDFRGLHWHALYNQSHLPIREQTEVVGHAVRAAYLFAAAADVALETGDGDLFRVVKKLWRNATERKMYLNGGIGSTLLGEAFTFDYDLPNEWAYTETCAAIALVFWSKRMLQHEIDGRYADVMERTLYNNILAALSIDGTQCFYRNPLASKPDPNYPKRHIRRAWHECACCPPNLARFFMSLGGYVYSKRKGSLFVHLFVDSDATFAVNGRPVRITQHTEYPRDGRVVIDVCPDAPTRFTVAVRIPGWTKGAALRVNGAPFDLQNITKKGYARVTRTWTAGDRVELELPMPIERVRAHPKVRQDAGKVALQRGPIVYCLEEIDNGGDLHEIILSRKAKLMVTQEGVDLGPHLAIGGSAIRRTADSGGDLYTTDVSRTDENISIKAIPYFLWANRGMAEMTVWLRED
ncbi:glycoside hydrolase family 127 protein [Bacteroidota bacterium]